MDWARTDARKAVGEDDYSSAIREGQDMTLGDAVGFALAQPVS
jgi:hypothetical protein